MITPLKKHPGMHGGVIALLVLATAALVVWTTHPRPAPAAEPTPALQPTAPSPGAVSTTPVDPPAKTAVVDDHSPLVAKGTTSYDEARTHHVGVPVHGWLKKTRETSLGRTVRAGETIGVIYSLDVLLTTASVVNQVRDYRGPEALDAERWRLLRWGMRQSSLTRIEQTLTPEATLPLIARVSGTVVAEAGAAAQLVGPEMGLELFTITDPTYVSVYATVPDARVARLAVGTPAKITIEGIARPVTAKIAYIYRHAEDGMRTIRFDLHSTSPRIKPDLPVTAVFASP